MPNVLNIQRRIVKRKKGSIVAEANYIVDCAKKLDARIVSFGSLLFFSTANGDAWMLDHVDGMANLLALEGKPKPRSFFVEESDENFKIEWKAGYQIENGVFIVFDKSNSEVTSYVHYPIDEILRFSKKR